MRLRARLAATALAVIVPTSLGLVLFDAIARHRAAEQLLTELVSARLPDERERCEQDPSHWGGRMPPDANGPREPPSHDGRAPDRGPPSAGRRPRPAELFAYDGQLRSLRADAPAIPTALADAIAERERATAALGWASDDIEILLRTPWNEGPCAYVLARGSTGDWGAVLPESWLWALPTLAVVMALLLAMGPVIGRLRRLTEAVSRSAATDYRQAIASDDTDEIGELARAFDAVGAEVREQLDVRARREQTLREFLANTTHDVMIPLTVLQGHLAGLRDHVAGGRTVAPELVASAMDEAHYIASLLQNLGAAARLDAGDGELHRGSVELGELVVRVVARHRPIAHERGIVVEHAVPEQALCVSADLTLLEQAIGNLVHNAVRYNHAGGHVAVVLDGDAARFSVRVVDDGPGIAAEQLDALLARGARGDDARTRAPEGQGIGLHIARRVVALHGFELVLAPSEYGGLEARVDGEVLGAGEFPRQIRAHPDKQDRVAVPSRPRASMRSNVGSSLFSSCIRRSASTPCRCCWSCSSDSRPRVRSRAAPPRSGRSTFVSISSSTREASCSSVAAWRRARPGAVSPPRSRTSSRACASPSITPAPHDSSAIDSRSWIDSLVAVFDSRSSAREIAGRFDDADFLPQLRFHDCVAIARCYECAMGTSRSGSKSQRSPQQLELSMPTRGGARKGAGRKRQSSRPRVAHASRADFRAEHPLHVTLRMRDDVPCLRAYAPWVAIVRALRAARARESLRVIHYSVMTNRFHLLVEADGREALTLGMRSLMTRLATALNHAFARRGPVFADRFHARAVTTPRATRYALKYVLLNARKHAAETGRVLAPSWIDPYSSAARFDGWQDPPHRAHANADFGTSPPHTWLLQWGWRRHGPLALDDLPGGHRGTQPMQEAA